MELKTKYNIKFSQFYDCLLLVESVTMEEASKLIKNTTCGTGRNGMATDAIRYFIKHGLARTDGNRLYAIKHHNHVDRIEQCAQELAIYIKQGAQITKANKQRKQQQDIVQPTLFTESVMREQERPIVTANDQLIQRIEALEARLNKITTLFQNL